MGQEQSLTKGRRNSLRSFSFRSLRRSKSTTHPSYTFRMNESCVQINQLNINLANEEELMTLTGITRELAKNIVEHRKIIGRFKKVEDLALVKGIGATKMQKLRLEISVSNRKLHSRSASRAPSYDSINSYESRSTCKSVKPVNINTATIFELQVVEGISQETAAAIVQYRHKKGAFKKLEDLLKVRGVDRALFNFICDNIVLEDTDEMKPFKSKVLTNGPTVQDFHKKLNSPTYTFHNGISNLSDDVFELLSIYSPRPTFQRFDFKSGDAPAMRIASWNLSDLSLEKVSNLGVKEVICRTILENGVSILVLQDVHVTALRHLCEELNNPKLNKIKDWNDERYWNFCMLNDGESKLGFMYDTQGVFDIKLCALYEGPSETRNECEALIASFSVDHLMLQLANLMIRSSSNLSNIYEKIKEIINPDDMSLVFIDLSDTEATQLPNSHLKSLKFEPNVITHSAQNSNQKIKSHNVSNILFNSKFDKQRTGANGVIKQGLTHLAIPNGWSWGGSVSPYSPVWVELYVNPITITSL